MMEGTGGVAGDLDGRALLAKCRILSGEQLGAIASKSQHSSSKQEEQGSERDDGTVQSMLGPPPLDRHPECIRRSKSNQIILVRIEPSK